MDLFQVKVTVRRMLGLLQVQDGKELKYRSFSFSRVSSLDSQLSFNLQQLASQSWDLVCLGGHQQNRDSIQQFLFLLESLKQLHRDKDAQGMKGVLERMEGILNLIVLSGVEIQAPKNIPPMIKGEIEEDVLELGKCFQSGCYRSSVILCGRILETALHRKYYEVTGVDILEKNPGIGLGTLVAKLVEKNVKFDPGLTQQIHLINQVRIFSVHKKHSTFLPNRAQANAIVLFTLDAVQKMFS